ncbi:MAG: hypothetical protein MJ236_03620 [Clostridia bacterium]|nr:hypothetical protein [Clostridia bacterium]
MEYMPNSNKKGIITAAALLLLSIIVSASSSVIPLYAIYFNIASYVILIAALYITLRFCISKYVYELKDTTLCVYKITGQKREGVAAIDLVTGKGCVKKPKTRDEKEAYNKKFGRTDLRMNYCRNFRANKYIYVTEFNGKLYEIYLEINEEFSNALNQKVLDVKAKMVDDE